MKTNRMIVTPKPVTIQSDELCNFIFEIPLYQRDYSWELEQVSDLFYDIDNSEENSPHFLGSILLYSPQDRDNVREVIDGQQRLTTIFLLLYCIRTALDNALDSIENPKSETAMIIRHNMSLIDEVIYQKSKRAVKLDTNLEPRLTTGKRDKRIFKSIIKGETINIKTAKVKSHKLLLNAYYNFIEPKVNEILVSRGVDNIPNFLDKVFSCRYIVMTAERKEDEILLFKTLNSRGIELSESDLIKNEICSNIRQKESDAKIDEALDIWDEMRSTLNKVNIDFFLFHFINSLGNAQDLRISIDANLRRKTLANESKPIPKSYPPISEKLVFTAYEKKISEFSDTTVFLETLNKSAEKYVQLYSPDDNIKAKKFLLGIRALNVTKCYPLLLAGLEILNEKNFTLLAQAVECISLRHSILKKDPKDLETLYYDLLEQLKSNSDIEKILSEIKDHNSMKQESEFEVQFCLSSPKSTVSKMILDRIIDLDNETLAISQKGIHLEHIMPERPRGEWKKLKDRDPDKYEQYNNRIGNLTLLKDKINQTISNFDFDVKKKGYGKSRININQDILAQDKWTYESIDKRQENLYQYAKEIWILK